MGEENYEILLGNYSEMDEERYVSIGDGNVYLVQDDPLDSFDIELSDMIRQNEIPEMESVTEIQFAGSENYKAVYRRIIRFLIVRRTYILLKKVPGSCL